MTNATPGAAIVEITAAIAEARRALADGAFVELVGLDGAVARICGEAHAIAAEERSNFLAGLTALAESLDQLALDLANRNCASRRRRASDAYGGNEERP